MSAIPSLSSLQCLWATHRLGSIARAADSLSLSHSAASRQLAGLEKTLGLTLLERNGRAASVNEAGKRFLREIGPAIERIEQACHQIKMGDRSQMLVKLAAPPTLAALKLIPQLAAFRQQRPDILVSLESHIGEVDFAQMPYDMVVARCKSVPEHCEARAYLREQFVPVCAPEMAHIPPEDQTLLQLVSRPQLWKRWFGSGKAMHYGPYYAHFPMLIQAARNRLGAALLPSFAAQEPLASGVLVALAEPRVLSDRHYMLITPDYRAARPAIQTTMDALAKAP